MFKSLLAAVADWVSLAWTSFRRLMGVVKSNRALLAFVLALLAVDLFCIAFYGLSGTLRVFGRARIFYSHPELLITTEGGIPEFFNYAKTILVVGLLVQIFRSTRQPVYVALALVFLVVLLDDALAIHEYVGGFLVRPLGLRPLVGSLRARDVGEVITWAALGALTVPLLLVGLARSSPRHRGIGLAFLLPFGLLLVCAIFFDQLHQLLNHSSASVKILLAMIEDGGEMVAITAACALALGARRELREGDSNGYR